MSEYCNFPVIYFDVHRILTNFVFESIIHDPKHVRNSFIAISTWFPRANFYISNFGTLLRCLSKFSLSGHRKYKEWRECFAPLSKSNILKNYQNHTLKYSRTNFEWFGNFWFWVKFWLMMGPHTQMLTKVSQANSVSFL